MKQHRILVYLKVLLPAFFAAASLTAQSLPDFNRFISGFSPAEQAEAGMIWADIARQQVRLDTIAPDRGYISDEALVRTLSLDNKEEITAQLAELREELAAAAANVEQAFGALAAWRMFGEALSDRRDLGKVYLRSLIVQKQVEKQLAVRQKQTAALERDIEAVRVNASLNQVSKNFSSRDWIVIVVYLIFTTILGGLLAGKQSSMKDFFLGGRKLAWPAVCGSIMATELSAATFLIAPAIVFSQGGDMTYYQLALGTIMARFIIGYFFIPQYFKQEIYSPYDYMGNRLGPRVKTITSVLFMIGGILAQGARVYIAAKALQVITGTNITTSIMIIGFVSVCWTIMGGITTVIWTDAIQFLLFSLGTIAALVFIGTAIDGGLMTVVREGIAAGKFRMLNLNFNPKEAYTLWCGLFASSFLTLGSHGTDQLMAQRMFTCKNENDARKAVVWSSSVLVMTYVLLFVGAGIFVYYKYLPFNNAEQVIVSADSMKVFAVYIVNVMPAGLSGLLMAAIFATAISTLDSILAALSQTTISIFYKPFIKPQASDKHYVRASRFIVLIWGIVLTGFAILCHLIAQNFADLIQFALAMAAYTYGALLGTFLLAFLNTKRDDMGLMWGVPLSVLIVFAFNWHQGIAQIAVVLVCLVLIIQAYRHFKKQPQKVVYVGIAAAIVMVVSMAVVGYAPDGQAQYISLAWPWHFPIGTAMTFFVGYLVGNRREMQA